MKEGSNYCIYRHLKPCGEVFYIGIGNLKRPYKKQNRSIFWKNVVEKCGYEIQVLKSDLSWEDAKELEIILISWYKRRDCCGGTLVNLTDGGEGTIGVVKSTETIQKIINAKRGKYSGVNSPCYGRKASCETLKKMSESRRGIKWSEEQHLKVAEYNKNNSVSQETRDKIRDANSRCGSVLAKKVINTKTLETYCCVQDASDTIGITKQKLTSWLNGRYANKSWFIYLENYYEGISHIPYKENKLSVHKHISFNKKNNRWFSNYKVEGKKVIKGGFNTEEEAYTAMILHPLYESR